MLEILETHAGLKIERISAYALLIDVSSNHTKQALTALASQLLAVAGIPWVS